MRRRKPWYNLGQHLLDPSQASLDIGVICRWILDAIDEWSAEVWDLARDTLPTGLLSVAFLLATVAFDATEMDPVALRFTSCGAGGSGSRGAASTARAGFVGAAAHPVVVQGVDK